MCGSGGSSPKAPAPPPPPQDPAEVRVGSEEGRIRKKDKNKRKGTRSLQIPLATQSKSGVGV